MRRSRTLSGLLLALTTPALPAAAAGGPYAVLTTAPAARPGCRVPAAVGGEHRAPLYSPETAACPVARVAGDEISLGELALALEGGHTARGSKASRGERPAGMDFSATLGRLVDVRLLAHEAREMGLLELPDSKEALESFRASTLRTMLQEQAAAGVKADAAQVDRLFKEAVKQWKLRSIRFDREEDASAFAQAVAKGGSFEALSRAAVAEKKAEGGQPAVLLPKHMAPALAEAAGKLEVGRLSPPTRVATGWVVLKLEGFHYPEDAAALAQARSQSLAEQQHQAVRRFHQGLVKKHATVDQRLLASLDFEAGGEDGFKALLKDRRPLVLLEGEPPITVSDLAGEIQRKYFHGLAGPIKEHKVKAFQPEAFETLLGVRLFAREARRQRLERRPDFLRKYEEYERVLAFNTFLERVILPGANVTEAEVQARYEQQKSRYTTPQLWRLDGLAFTSAPAARSALEKARGGTDPEWLRTNAEGLLDPAKAQLKLDGSLLSSPTLPASLVKALAGAQAGDLRLYASDDGTQHYLLRVQDQVAPGVRPYPDAREALARELQAEKVAAGARDYAAKLRQVQPVEVLITRVAG